MSIITSVADGRVTSRILDTARRALVVSALGAAMLLARALPVEAATLPQHSCTPELEKLMAEWNAAGFQMPIKPTQAIVQGRSGRVSSGPEVTYMISQIRQAVGDHTRLSASSPRLPGTRAHRAATSGECPAAAAPRSASAILYRPATLGVALPGLAAGLERHGAGQARNRDPVASQGLPAPLAVAITASGTAQDEHRDP